MPPASAPDPTLPLRRSYPLSALFLLVAVAGVLSAFMGPAARLVAAGQLGGASLLGAAFLGGFCFALLGAVIGAYHYQRLRGILLGIGMGLIVGSLVGPITLVHKEDASGIALLAVMSIGLLAATGLVLRRRRAHRSRGSFQEDYSGKTSAT